jgi:hypothetical protein
MTTIHPLPNHTSYNNTELKLLHNKESHPSTVSYKWDDDEDMFTPPPTIITNSLTGNQLKIFRAITEDIKENSGLKKSKLWIEVLLFLFVVIVGYTVAFFLVKANLTVLGGLMIFITSLFVYFVYMGYKALRGT